MNAPLCTLAHPAQASQEIRKSRFLCQAAPVSGPDAALAFLARVGDPQATHNCWAYRIGQSYRFSDDGEPAGTAGKPILQAIDGQGFDQVMLVVARWFGGIKLGAGGLMRAYGGVAAECLRLATRIPLVHKTEVEFDLPFAALAILKARLTDFDADCLAEHYGSDGASLRLALPEPRVAALAQLLADLTRGRSAVRRGD
ncbi:IMPACT family protein [Tahibacter caeni]|uniref:IMPACT family protein n=1 Tax=Tahibacter caeni TaxID=1453545 RepID=UPI00214856B5|nr:YigZ family protein [Tahibacter caeni]